MDAIYNSGLIQVRTALLLLSSATVLFLLCATACWTIRKLGGKNLFVDGLAATFPIIRKVLVLGGIAIAIFGASALVTVIRDGQDFVPSATSVE